MLQDLRFAWRTLRRSPLFTLVAVACLALGIGANTAIFSLVDQIFLRKLPVAAPEELVLVKDPGPYGDGSAWSDDDGHSAFSHPVFLELRAASTNVFSGLAARGNVAVNASDGNRPAQLVEGEIVSGNYFEVLGLRPALGRLFTGEDDQQRDAHPVVVLSYPHWQLHYAGRADVIDSTVRINAYPMTIVGVAPKGFAGTQAGRAPAVFVPMMMKARITPGSDNLADRTNRWLQLIGRVKPGVTMAEAAAGLRAALQPSIERTLAAQSQLPDEVRQRARTRRAYLSPGAQGRETLRRDSGEALLILLGMTGLVLIVACSNVANLLLARGAARQREIAIRLSIGASRGALVRQLLVESALLSVAAGVAGILVASWTLALLERQLPADAGPLLAAALDGRTLAITLAVSLLTGVLFGLVPAWQATRSDLARVMKEQANSTTLSASGAGFRRLLVAAQFALSLVLLVAGGLLARSLANLGQVSPGFDVERLVTFRMDATLSGYKPADAPGTYLRLRDQLAALPGVRAAGVAQVAVLADSNAGGGVRIDGCKNTDRYGNIEVLVNRIDPGYLATIGAPLREGRGFTDGDAAETSPVAIVNESLQRTCFPDSSPLGHTIRQGNKAYQIVGVVPDTRHSTVRVQAGPFVYLPLRQARQMSDASFYLRTTQAGAGVIGEAERVVRAFDPNLAVLEARTMREQINETIYNERLSAFLSVVFALLAVTLAAIGLYGVLAFLVTCRTREIGIRLALGAGQARVEWMVLREVLLLAGAGLVAGLPAAWALARVMRSLLFGLEPGDPLVFASAALLLLGTALFAGYWPARQAARVDPMRALRYD